MEKEIEKTIKRIIYFRNNLEHTTPNIQVAIARRDTTDLTVIYSDNSISTLIIENENI